jgi:putative solute:sodium symporter small subunit
MSQSDRDNYWRQTRQLTAGLFILWVLVTFVMNWFARELNEIVIFGFPLGFYMGAQGILIVYLLIIWFYNRRMRALDEEYRIEDE